MTITLKARTLGSAAAGVLALSLGLLAGAAAAQVPGNGPAKGPAAGSGVFTPGLPDITTSGGYIGTKKWTDGGVVVLDDMGPVIATQVGPNKDMCRFVQMDYQPGNQGVTDAGASVAKVYRGNTVVNTDNFAAGYLAAGSWRPFEKWQMDLKEGMNSVRLVLDVNKQVAESNESNTFGSRIDVRLDCDGDGFVGGKPVGGSLKAKPRG
ncbi:MAG: hypothetical protein Kow00114_15870 [Kiloniellaceae bacterium]